MAGLTYPSYWNPLLGNRLLPGMCRMKNICKLLFAAAAFSLILLGTAAGQDVLTTLEGLRVEGKIIKENDEEVHISTEYGDLRFMKMNLKAVERAKDKPSGGGSSGGSSSDPFAVNDFSGGGGFGGSTAGAPSFDANMTDDPFAAARSPRESRNAAAAAPVDGEPETTTHGIPAFGETRTTKPIVESGFDAVVYGMNKQAPIQVRNVAAAQWANAIEDTQLQVGSELKTNESKSARMLLRGKKDELRLPEKSHIEIEKLSDDSEEVVLNLRAGSVWVDVVPRSEPDAFQIRTPELTAGVRGTNFRVDRQSGSSKVSVFAGTVQVTANRTGAFVTLNANQAAVVNMHGQILDLIAVPKSEQEIYDEWQGWAFSAGYGAGTSAAAFSPVAALSQRIAQDNAQWEAAMQEYQQNVAEMRYQDKLEEYANAFLRYADDTGRIPTTEQGWSPLKFDDGSAGWNGPYVEGSIPPLDPWKRPLVYKHVVSPTGRIFGRVYSLWQDGRDQGGVNSSVDKVALIRYYSLQRFANDPEVNPPN